MRPEDSSNGQVRLRLGLPILLCALFLQVLAPVFALRAWAAAGPAFDLAICSTHEGDGQKAPPGHKPSCQACLAGCSLPQPILAGSGASMPVPQGRVVRREPATATQPVHGRRRPRPKARAPPRLI